MGKLIKKNQKKSRILITPSTFKRLTLGMFHSIGLCMICHQAYGNEANIKQLDEIVVEIVDLTENQLAKQNLEKVAGGINLVEVNNLERTKTSTNEDVFKFQPGIYAKSSGNEGTKISIRGSGINRAPGAHASGLFVLLDDIPFTGPGGTPYELLEPTWLDRVEVLRGANGFEKGALSLGGAINYISKNGDNADLLQIRAETGSRGYQKYQMSSGQNFNNLDYYVSLNTSKYNGYQDQGKGDSQGLMGNIGIQLSPNLDTRFYFRYRETEHESPGRLTKQQILENPTSANPYNHQYDTKRIQPGSTWLANKTRYEFEQGGTLQASFAYHQYPMDLRESPYRTDVKYSDITGHLSYTQPYDLFRLNSLVKIGLRSTTHRPDSGVRESLRFDLNHYEAGTLTRKYTYRGSDNVLNIHHDTEIKPNLWLTTDLAGIYTHRQSEVYYPITNRKVDLTEWDVAPRLGLRYQINPQFQVYGNLSRTIEPAHPWSMIWSSNQYFDQNSGPASGRQSAALPLKHQKANTFEIGGRGENSFGIWDLSYYYTKVKNELLSVEISPPPNVNVSESNASPTIHQGLELGLNQTLFSQAHVGDLKLIQSYNYSDFRYKNDKKFGENQLAGLPKHYYQAELTFDFYNGAYFALNTEYASKIAVDYANSFFTDAYHIWGASLGYQSKDKNWDIWIDFNNITDKKYAATVTPGYDDKGMDNARLTPGEGFSTYTGFSIRF